MRKEILARRRIRCIIVKSPPLEVDGTFLFFIIINYNRRPSMRSAFCLLYYIYINE